MSHAGRATTGGPRYIARWMVCTLFAVSIRPNTLLKKLRKLSVRPRILSKLFATRGLVVVSCDKSGQSVAA